ncbi:cystathionine beta-synthase [Nannocystis exedens]|uniref:Cystathionine beta-synthase n=1 Tax=Nannocystis exedens TaxID=54 RepID=A0A1I1T410_9BACT|nr:pyridoxal-phosphate dependent enzyme [Nannocystis exedens]PCC66882.1 pyridoxal-5'-phosphate-dependent protein subunit beta [Nannocystis exedens]SFD51858.1 cystathionine beta-synthase [Nannocystis exedens]
MSNNSSRSERALMKGARADVTAAIGNTPIVRLNHVTEGLTSEVYVKLEMLNPAGSMKDRVALNIIRDAETRGMLQPGGTIVEATSGNTGAGLAMVAATRGYKCIFVMPDKMSREKIDNLKSYGAKVVLCPTAVDPSDPRSYYSVSRRIVEETPGAFYANQYHNPANPEAHYLSTAPELWEQTGGEFDVFVSGMGTGGTLSGCGRYFKEKNPAVKIVGVDPVGSLYYEYVKTGRLTKPFSYYVEGIGEDFLPSTMNLNILDEIVQVDDKECFIMTRELVRREGISVGGSGGAAVLGAIKYARTLKQPKRLLVLLPDSSTKYLSKIFNDDWMRQNGFLDEDEASGYVAHILKRKPGRTITATRDTSVRVAIQTLKENSISQLPILDEHGRHCGIVSEIDLLNFLVRSEGRLDEPLADLVNSDYATVTPHTRIQLLRSIFNDAKVVLVTEGDRLLGLLTKIDLIDYLASQQ